MISSHAICDQCERKLIPRDTENMTEDYLAACGWVVVRWTEGQDDESWVDEAQDFCSFACAGAWCTDEVAGKHVREKEEKT